MTELLFICTISVLGVAFATSVWRWLLARSSGDEELVLTAGRVSGGMRRYLRRQNAVVLSVAGVVGAFLFVTFGVAFQTEAVTTVSPREHGVWMTASYVLGAAFGVGAGWLAAFIAGTACSRVAAGARRSLDDSLQIALRAGAVAGAVALTLALLGLALLFLAAYLILGGLGDPATALGETPRIPRLLVGFSVGAGFVALLAQLGGGIFGNVADIGADVAGLEGSLTEGAADNPATIADLVGDTVGDVAARAATVLACAAAESTAAMLVAARLFVDNADLPSATAVVLLPLVARTFSIVSAWFGVLVVRTDDTEVPMTALGRGLYVTTLLYAVGAAGSAKWLLGERWLPFAACAVIGAAWSLLSLYATQYYSEQKHRPVRTLAEVARGGPTLATLRGVATAAQGSFVQIALTALAAIGAYSIGAASGLEGGGLFGVAMAAGGMLGSAPYVLAMDALGGIADVAGGLIEMTMAAERPDVRARARLLDAMGTTAKSFTRSLSAMVSTLASLLFLSVFLHDVTGGGPGAGTAITGLDLASPMLCVGALAGLGLVLAFDWMVLGRIVSASRDLVHELRLQLLVGSDGARVLDRGMLGLRPGDASGLGAQLGARKSGTSDANDSARRSGDGDHLACVEIISRIALRGMMAPAALGVGLPLLGGLCLRLGAGEDTVVTSAVALVAFLLVATLTTALGSLLFTHAGSAWDNAKKYIETGAHGGRYVLDVTAPGGRRDPGGAARAPLLDATGRPMEKLAARVEIDNPTYVAALIGDTIGDPLKGAVGPAAQALVTTLAALAVAFLPFFL
jgi:K(+)-stimulated pyrophosphate-energized sodium pump